MYKELVGASVLRPEVLGDGFELVIVRELTGGIYFGEHTTVDERGEKVATDVIRYSKKEIERAAHVAFAFAMQRSKKMSVGMK